MNFEYAFKLGQQGLNKGLPMGEGLKSMEMAINGIQKARIYTVAASPKGGKSTLVDNGFCIEPAIFVLTHNAAYLERINQIDYALQYEEDNEAKGILISEREAIANQMLYLEIIYFSFEIDRVAKEFDFAAHFLERDHGFSEVILPVGKTYKGKDRIPMGSAYLRGELVYDGDENSPRETITVSPEIEAKLLIVYRDRIIPLFGQYDGQGLLIKKGLMIFVEKRDNPTGLRNFLADYAVQNGTFLTQTAYTKEGQPVTRNVGYKPNNPRLLTLVITDHLRKLQPERGFKTKETVDKFSEYAVEFRNMCQFSFVHIIHLNRAVSDVARRKSDGDRLFPMSDDIKETGNLSEDSNYIFTLFNPNDDKYSLNKHFGVPIRKVNGDLMYPNMRTIHLVESRHCEAPQHFRVNMYGNTKKFEKLKI